MALQYFLYDTDFGNTIIDRSNTSFTPTPPYEEIYIDFFIPETQPLYLYANSGGTGGTIIVNSQENIDNYLDSITPAPTADDNITYGEFTGTTSILENYTGNGIISGMTLSVNELDTGRTTINISAGVGYIVNNHTNPNNPILTKIEYSGQTGITVQYVNTDLITYIAIDSSGNTIQQTTEYTASQRRDYVILGLVVHTDLVKINTVNNLPDVVLDSHNQLNDFFDAFKTFNINGNIFEPNGANLFLNKTEGNIFKRGVNFNTNNKNPHIKLTQSINTITDLRYRLSDGTEYLNSGNTVSLYYENDLGNRVPLPSTGYSVQHIVLFPSNLVRIQYGQGEYPSMANAITSIYSDPYVVETNMKENGLLRGYLIVKGSVTNLTNINDAVFIEVDRFGSMPKDGGNVALGLQEVTEVLPYTNIETTFDNGLVLDKFRPSTDSVSAITINKTDGTTPVITIDTVSGLTGFGTIPTNMIHTYGIDDSNNDINSTHKNGIRIDGVAGGDKDLVWADNGQDKWFAEIYRNEEGRFWYLYNEDADLSPITVSESGRIGINNTTNIIDYEPLKIKGLYAGTSTNNVFFSGLYDKNFISIYQLEIDDAITIPNTFRWRSSVDNGATYNDWSDSTGCTTGTTIIDSGVEVSFIDVSGFTSGDTWQITAFPQLSPATLSLVANRLNKVFVTYNYTASTPTFFDLSTSVNTTTVESGFAFQTGTTLNAAFAGGNTKINSMFVNVIQSGIGFSMIVEYWNGAEWTDISIGSDYFVDGTENLTKTGTLSWNISTMTDWTPYDLNGSGDEFYWLRLTTASVPTKSPILGGMARGGNNRFSVYSSAFDLNPSFNIDALGRTAIGGGNITGNNKLQINTEQNLDVIGFNPSLVELDSNNSDVIDFKIKLSSDDNISGGIVMGKTRGTLLNSTNVISGDSLGHLYFAGLINSTAQTISIIESTYTGNGTTSYGDLIFKTASGSDPIEKVRISGIGTGFGNIIPTAQIHIQSGTTSVAPLKFTSGGLLSTPQIGAVEFNGSQWYGTVSGNTRKTFAFLESPIFTGTPVLPITTLFDGTSLIDFISNSGGTNNNSLVHISDYNTYTGNTDTRITGIENDITYISGVTDTKLPTTTFNAYTGGTIAWDKINKTGSDLADLETRNAIDVNYTETNWNITNVNDGLNKVTDYVENTQGTGRISPKDVLFGIQTTTLKISGGTGYINYENFHKKITWSGQTYETSGSTEGLYYVYVDSNGDVQVSSTQPNRVTNINLGFYYQGGFIGVIQQSGDIIQSATNRIADFAVRQGTFIYDNGGKIELLSGSTLKLSSSPCKIQYGLLDSQLPAISSNDASTFKFLNYYNSADYEWALNYHFSISGEGKIPTGRYNQITGNSFVVLSGYSMVFTQFSNIVTSTSDLTSLGLENSYIYFSGDTDVYASPVSGVTWDGTGTTITLETIYVGAGGTGVGVGNFTLHKLPAGKYTKSLIVRDADELMFLVLGQTYYDTEDEAIAGVLPGVPTSLKDTAIKMAYIVNVSDETDLTGKIYDIRPLPYNYREGGQLGGGTTITSHGSLTGLAADDHLQYLRTDGSRNITGIQKYQSQPTFTTDLDVITKKYSDDQDILKLNITTFNSYTGTTVPANYYNKTEINAYSASTLTNINSRLLISDFNTYTGTTAPATFVNLTGGTITGDLKVEGNIYLTGTTPTIQELKDSYLLGAITADGRIIKSNSPTLSISQKVVDISASTGITELYGIYYVDATAGDVTLTIPNSVLSNDGSRFSIIKKGGTNNVIITTVGGTQNIGNATSQSISQTDKGLTIVSDNGNNKWLVVQDSRFLQGSVEGELQYWDTDTGKWKVTGSNLLWGDIANTLSVNGTINSTNLNVTGSTTLVSPTLTGVPTAPTAAANTSTTQIATTAYVVGQAANVNPLMDGTVAIGTSLRYARQDHRHASDTSRVAKVGDTMSGPLIINSNLTVSGFVNNSGNTKTNGITYLGNVTPDVNQQNFSVIDVTTKKVANSGTKFHVYGTEFHYAQSLAGTTTTVVTPTYETKLTINTATVPAGTYKVTVSFQFGNGSTNRDMLSRIHVDGTILGSYTNFELGDANSYVQVSRTMFITFATAATHTIESQFSNELSATLTIYDHSLEFVRVS